LALLKATVRDADIRGEGAKPFRRRSLMSSSRNCLARRLTKKLIRFEHVGPELAALARYVMAGRGPRHASS
jgi:hypothetical protein